MPAWRPRQNSGSWRTRAARSTIFIPVNGIWCGRRSAATRILTADSDEDATILDGGAPEIEQLIMAAGTISFFGTRRVVVLPEIDPAAIG